MNTKPVYLRDESLGVNSFVLVNYSYHGCLDCLSPFFNDRFVGGFFLFLSNLRGWYRNIKSSLRRHELVIDSEHIGSVEPKSLGLLGEQWIFLAHQ